MNSLRKTFFALTLIVAFPITAEAFSFQGLKNLLIPYIPTKESRIIQYAQNNPKHATAIGIVATAGTVGGAYLLKKYRAKAKTSVIATTNIEVTPTRKLKLPTWTSAKAKLNQARTSFTQLSRPKKAAVVIGGAAALVGIVYATKLLLNRLNNIVKSTPNMPAASTPTSNDGGQ